ncbi:flagellar hook-basal body protein [Paenibacillus sp. GCM10027626]|uniref:flagellar hook-basal body protein n=1 Tax=Paenibacillus sp. GCM10027626 TaxID=3273411 RepID=UPI00363D3939
MNSSMINAMVSMNGSQQKLDLLADNIANLNTVGYKRKGGTFADLLTTLTNQPKDFELSGRTSPRGFQLGSGARFLGIQPDLSQGALVQTNEPFDLAIAGDALFELQTKEGKRAYTRNGAMQLTIDQTSRIAYLTTKDGYTVVGTDGNRIEIPKEADSVRIEEDGSVFGVTTSGRPFTLGQIRLVKVTNPAMLSQVADNLFVIAEGMNENNVLQRAVAGVDSDISIRQGYIEQSNVNMTEEMTELINVQRAYQLSARALTSSDTMMGLANNLRG